VQAAVVVAHPAKILMNYFVIFSALTSHHRVDVKDRNKRHADDVPSQRSALCPAALDRDFLFRRMGICSPTIMW
jgi:hypothetical protein